MLKWLFRRQLAAFERRHDYDMSYARALLDADPRALLALAKLTGLARYRRDIPPDVYYAAKLSGTLAEDCGPCTQLVVGMALSDGVRAETLAALLANNDAALTAEVRLGADFARALLAHDPALDELRPLVLRRFGARGLVSLCFAVSAAGVFPRLKYGLGYGAACSRVVVAGEAVTVVKKAA